MAGQLHLAYSTRLSGAAIIAGGPWFCARGEVSTALGPCMDAPPEGPSTEPLLEAAQVFAQEGMIDPLSGLEGDRVWLFSGTEDETVRPPSVAAAATFYREIGVPEDALVLIDDVPAGHAFLAPDGPNACAITAPPFINDCGRDMAGELLTFLYGDLSAPVQSDPASLVSFDQAAFLGNPSNHSMSDQGFVYIPAACSEGATCRLHVALHGCRQTPDDLGDSYARTTGYNEWAEANDLVILYPQADASLTSGNPNGCWDWWGYDSPDYATRFAPQMAAIAGMAAALGAPLTEDGPFCLRHPASNWIHFWEGRAEFCGGIGLCAAGSGDTMGGFFSASALFESPPGHFSLTDCS